MVSVITTTTTNLHHDVVRRFVLIGIDDSLRFMGGSIDDVDVKASTDGDGEDGDGDVLDRFLDCDGKLLIVD